MTDRNTYSKQKSLNTYRIIGGVHRGRKLPIVNADGLRPTGDRVRETLFNWLQWEIEGKRVVDLFSGAGALGIEALSRRAAKVTLIEKQSAPARQLRENITLLNEQAVVIQKDALVWLMQAEPCSADIVFVDPPFQESLWADVIKSLPNILSDGALCYFETPKKYDLQLPAAFSILKSKTAGQVTFSLYQFTSIVD